MTWDSEEIAARLKAAEHIDDEAFLKIGRPTGTPLQTTILFDSKLISERARLAAEEEDEINLNWLPSQTLRTKLVALWEARKKAGRSETLRELHDRLLTLAVEKLNEQEASTHL